MLAASGQPKLWDLPPPDARKMALQLTSMVEGKEAIGKIENRTLPGPAGSLPFRVYTPVAANDEPSGGIIYFHGGAWVFGDLDTHDGMCRALSLMKAVAGLFRWTTGSRLSINSLRLWKTPMPQQSG